MRNTKRFLTLLLAGLLFVSEVPWNVLQVQAQPVSEETEEIQSDEEMVLQTEEEETDSEEIIPEEEGNSDEVVIPPEEEVDQPETEASQPETEVSQPEAEVTQPENAGAEGEEEILQEDPVVEAPLEEVPLEEEIPAGTENTLTSEEIVVENEPAMTEAAGDEIIDDNTKLAAVELQALNVSCREIELSWTLNEDAAGYILYQVEDADTEPVKLAEIVLEEDDEAKYIVSELIPETEYKFVISPYQVVEEEICEGEYSEVLSVQTSALSAVSLDAETSDYCSIELSWTKQSEADGYEIYRRNDEGEFELLTTLTSADTLNYTDTGLAFETTYEYQVIPLIIIDEDTIYRGAASLSASAKTELMSAEISAVTSVNYKTLKISWGEVAGANGYEIYRSTSSSKGYVLLKTITSGSTLSYNDKKATPNKKLYYKIRAYRVENGEKIYGSESAAVSGKAMFTQVTKLKASASDYTTIKLSWSKVKGASKYQIYYSTSKDSGYKRLKTVKGTSLSWKKPVCGQTYYFKVRAIKTVNGKNVYGDYSTIVSKKTTIKKPSVSAAKKSYSSIKISWKKVAGAQKYQVYWSTSKNGEYKRLKTTTGTSYTHTGRTIGKTYYYKVCAIRQNSKSAFSSVVSATTSLGKITGLSVQRKSSGYKLSWNAVDGAKAYEVYRSSLKDGSYKCIGTTSKAYFTDKSAGKSTYYYKVIGYRGTAHTGMSDPVMAYAKRIGIGIDVSEYQGSIDWEAVENDGIQFAMLRIVKGTTDSLRADARFEENYRGAKEAGLSVGVYRYCYALTTLQARQEAYKVLEVLDGRDLEYPIVLDVEDTRMLSNVSSDSRRSDIILAFKEVIEDAGYDFAIYANLDWINNHLNMDKLDDVDIWLARWRDYDSGPGYTGKGNLIMWQFTDSGKVDGISGSVDMDVSY